MLGGFRSAGGLVKLIREEAKATTDSKRLPKTATSPAASSCSKAETIKKKNSPTVEGGMGETKKNTAREKSKEGESFKTNGGKKSCKCSAPPKKKLKRDIFDDNDLSSDDSPDSEDYSMSLDDSDLSD